MSVKNLFMMIFMVILFPIAIIFHDADAFFLFMSIVLVLISINGLAMFIPAVGEDYQEDDLEDMDESIYGTGEVFGIDIGRLGYGCIIMMDLMVITYFLYSFFMVNILFMKAFAIILIAYWVYDIISVIDSMINGSNEDIPDNGNKGISEWKERIHDFYLWIHHVGTICFIIIAFSLKYILHN
ncbi:MAG: hypothetical protein GX066_02325 [Clostridiaceae bacterium]|nr:hypothetical protein [Clostridiaceae bacterium]